MIEIQDLYKYYGERRALGPLSARIEQGQVVGLLGLNGAGKTTTLRILACDLLPSAGTVRVDGLDVVEEPDLVRAKIGYLPDVPPLYPEMTVAEYLAFAARLRGVLSSDVKARVSAAVEQTMLGSVFRDPIHTLSHGYRQRVGIAQAVLHRPSLVILDEPISGLDPAQIVEMRALVRSLAGAHTVLVSSHILREISETCDHILVIRDGTIVAQGTEAELSARFREGMSLEVTVAEAPGGSALALLRALEGVTEVVQLPSAEAGTASYRVHTSGDRRGDVARAVVHAGLALVGLSRGARDLEAAFLELAQAPAPPRSRRDRQPEGDSPEVAS